MGIAPNGVSQGHTVSVDPEAWKIIDGKLYLNYSKACKRRGPGISPATSIRLTRTGRDFTNRQGWAGGPAQNRTDVNVTCAGNSIPQMRWTLDRPSWSQPGRNATGDGNQWARELAGQSSGTTSSINSMMLFGTEPLIRFSPELLCTKMHQA